MVIFRFREYFGHFLCFGGILVIFWVLGGTLVIFWVSTVFWSFFRFWEYFGHFWGFEGILVFLVFGDVLVIFLGFGGYFGNF